MALTEAQVLAQKKKKAVTQAEKLAPKAAGKSAKNGFKPSFHFWLIIGMILFVFVGFGLTYIGPVAAGTRTGDSPIVHLHGAAFFSWMVLLLVQSALVGMKNVKLHRSLGTFGIAVATFVFIMGVFITIAGASVTDLSGNGAGVFYLSVFAPPSFAAIFILAIRALPNKEVHRNLILIATIAILMPGINRVYMAGVGLTDVPFYQTYMTMNVFLAAVLWHEWKKLGKISRQTWIGAAIVVVPQLFLHLVSSTQGWRDFVFALGSLAEYH